MYHESLSPLFFHLCFHSEPREKFLYEKCGAQIKSIHFITLNTLPFVPTVKAWDEQGDNFVP